MAVDRRGAQPFLEHGQVGVGPQGGGGRQEVGLVDVHDEAGDGHARALCPRVPVEAGGQGGNLLPRCRLSESSGSRLLTESRWWEAIAVSSSMMRAARPRGRTSRRGQGGGRCARRKPRGSARSRLRGSRLVGQADAGLDEGDHVVRRIVRVGAHVCADEASDAFAHEAAHLVGELLMGSAGVDGVEVGAQGSGTGFFDGVLVEELSPQCGDAVRIRIVQRAIGCVLGDCARVLLGCVAQRVERPSMGRSAGIVWVASHVPLTCR